MKYLAIFILFISCKHHRDCGYQLPDWCTLKYNKITKEYVINTGRYYSGIATRYTLHMIPPDVYFGLENNPMLYEKEANSYHADISGAYRYSDSCLAKGSLEYVIQQRDAQFKMDDIAEQEKRKRDSINNDFKPLHEDTTHIIVPDVKPNRTKPEKSPYGHDGFN